ncbi:MAG: anhydro-N-acetylmuramic acid kinase [Acidobacteriota bacterium]|nr:anhydro-N-acetylmuramic acid kinase [Acidobacteriota bacterium]
MRVAGIMSGTSLDGIDVAVINIHKQGLEVLEHRSTPYPPDIRKAILDVSNTQTTTAAISRLNFRLGELYAEAAGAFKDLDLIGCHGQTIYHEGATPVNSLQLGEAAIIAERTGVPVVSNFRARDIAAGGQGAPLVPFADWLLFRHKKRGRVVLNIGGIANFTFLPADAKLHDILAFDTGPGNMVMDALVSEMTGGAKLFDRDGAIAASGKINHKLLAKLTGDEYYQRLPPKSAGREQYGAEFCAGLRKTKLPFPDLIATATALTATTIAEGVRRFAGTADDLVASGGGVHNETLVGMLQSFLPKLSWARTGDFGIPGDAKEAVAFAVLAYRTWRGKTSNVPTATGARHAVILGDITQA